MAVNAVDSLLEELLVDGGIVHFLDIENQLVAIVDGLFLLFLEQVCNYSVKHLNIERFSQIGICANFITDDLIFGGLLCSKQNDGEMAVFERLFEYGSEVVTVHPIHDDVGDDKRYSMVGLKDF